MEAIKTLDDRIEAAHQATFTVADQLAMSRQEVRELRATLEKNDAQMLRMATCAGEFARDACTQAEAVPIGVVEVLAEIVKMMDDGDECGAGSVWYKRAVAALAQRAGSGLEAPTIREFQNLDRGRLYDICCRQSHAIKEADKCIKRYQDKLRSGDAQPDSERDAVLSNVMALAWKWHGDAVKDGFGSSESAQELFELLGWPDDPSAAMAAQQDKKSINPNCAFCGLKGGQHDASMPHPKEAP